MTPSVNQTPQPHGNGDDHLGADTIAVLAVLVATTFVTMLNETALAVVLPAIMAEFSITAGTAQWALTGVMLTLAIMMPMAGWILDRFSTRHIFFTAVLSFLAGSVVAALSPTFPVMLVGRVLQAVGTAIVIPLLMTVAMTVVPPARRGTVMGVISVVMAVGPALGPTFAGAVMSMTTWHVMFWIMAVLVVMAGVVGVAVLRNVGQVKKIPIDAFSVLLSAFAFGGIVYGLSSIGMIVRGGDAAVIAVGVSVIGVVALALFVTRQRALKNAALLNLAPLGQRNFVVAMVIVLLYQATLLGVSATVPLYMQGALLATALVAGLVNLPGGLVETVLSPIAGVLYDRFGPRPLVIPGTAISAAALVWMTTLDHTAPIWLVVAMYAVYSVGLGLALTPLMTAALSSLPKDLYSHGSAIINTLMQLAGAAGTAVMIAIFDSASRQADASREILGAGGAQAFTVAAGLLIVAVLLTFFLRNPAKIAPLRRVSEGEATH